MFSPRKIFNRLRPQRRRRLLEQLEQRLTFDVSNAPFLDAASLTVSVVPDGTTVGLQSSQLQSSLSGQLPQSGWQVPIARALQTWANASNTNFGFVDDSGHPLGVSGPMHGDERFGDIRLAGIDLPLDTLAEAVAEDSYAAGSWAGDILFNTDAPPATATGLEAIMLHETGHVLGLDHSTNPQSVMFAHTGQTQTTLAQADIAAVQARYGARAPDGNELQSDNNTMGRATRIRGSSNDTTGSSGFNGTQTWVHFGGLQNAQDVDNYFVPVASNYSGPLAFRISSKEISLSRFKVTLIDERGNILLTKSSTELLGSSVDLALNQTVAGKKYYLKVESGGDAFWAAGDYAITIATPAVLASQGSSIADWTRTAHRWYSSSEATLSGFSWQMLANPDDHPSLNDDNGADDASSNAPRIDPEVTSTNRVVHRVIGSLTSITDVDNYRVRSPSTLTAETVMIATLDSLENEGLIPNLTIYDTRGNPIPTEIRVNGSGQVMLVAGSLTKNVDYTVRVAKNPQTPAYAQGNYLLTVEWTAAPEPVTEFAIGQLSASQTTDQRYLYVAESELFAFSLAATAGGNTSDGVAWMTIFDEQQHVVGAIAAPLGQVRSAPAMVLQPGAYYVQFGYRSTSPSVQTVNYRLFGEVVSQHVGPLLGDPIDEPFYTCGDPTTVMYCYPGALLIQVPVPWEFTQIYVPIVNPPPPPQQPDAPSLAPAVLPTPPAVVQPPADMYFWSNEFLPTNPYIPQDVDGDGTVAPLDALLIVNRLNQVGGTIPVLPPGVDAYLDVNGDGVIGPVDALLVINYLNR